MSFSAKTTPMTTRSATLHHQQVHCAPTPFPPFSGALMSTLLLLIALPGLTLCTLLLYGLLIRKRWLWLRAALAGLLVLAVHVSVLAYQDHSWAATVRQQLPADAIIVSETRAPVAQHPWTLLSPPVSALVVVSDVNTTMVTDGELLLEFERLDFSLGQNQPNRQTAMLNCTRQDLVSQLDGSILIESLPAGDPLLRLLCPVD